MFEHLDITSLLAHYGYWAIFIGCLLEGETILILGGLAAHQTSLRLVDVIVVATLGGMIGDQILFWIGRSFGPRLLPRLHRKQAAIDRVSDLIKRYPTASIFSVRFLYGMRLVGPLVIGASRLSPFRFAVINLLGAGVWATLFVMAGYWAGQALEHLLGNLKPYRLPIILGVVVIAAGVALYRHHRAKARIGGTPKP
ncbi:MULTISPECIES: DedA family protein [unclassified Pseudomonas]|uniref:DedA family protein n=1 Tax=unclassified Pseudomonas TaxID=196821 RepID=UPI000D3B7BCE|nr:MULTISPECIES: DedA family protein [unclassified Pseudomonas]RAU49588.1 DedA family protein [Pseudomonas sp. RIT 409]RAU55673.1 DedA family protein [Pseudomonas sp. RIT 412]